MFQWLKRICSVFLIALLVTVYLSIFSPTPALAATPLDLGLLKHVEELLSNKQLVEDTKRFLGITPATICRAYCDQLNGVDSSTWAAIEEGGTAAFAVIQAVASASAAGAGSLAGYAGIASAVSHLGLGGLTTAIAGMMGSSATGAAATAVVTSVVGGPLVMGTLLAGGTGAAAFGTYELGKFTVEKLGSWAESYCGSR